MRGPDRTMGKPYHSQRINVSLPSIADFAPASPAQFQLPSLPNLSSRGERKGPAFRLERWRPLFSAAMSDNKLPPLPPRFFRIMGLARSCLHLLEPKRLTRILFCGKHLCTIATS